MPLPLPPTRATGDGDPAADVNLLSAAIAELQPLLEGSGVGFLDLVPADPAEDGDKTYSALRLGSKAKDGGVVTPYDYAEIGGAGNNVMQVRFEAGVGSGTFLISNDDPEEFGYGPLGGTIIYPSGGMELVPPAADGGSQESSFQLYHCFWTGSESVQRTAAIWSTTDTGTRVWTWDSTGAGTPTIEWQAFGEIVSTEFQNKYTVDASTGLFSFKHNGGDPYFQFNKRVKATAVEAAEYGFIGADPVGGTGAYLGLDPGNITVAGTQATIAGSTLSSIHMSAHWWNGSTSVAASGHLGFLPEGGAPCFRVNRPFGAGTAGAEDGGRYAGGTTSGAPVSGTFLAGDFISTADGHMWVCSVGGTPGTWRDLG